MMANGLMVFVGGGIGAVLRYGLQLLMGKTDGHSFPAATFIANIAGCFVIGLLAAGMLKYKFSEPMVLFVFTGIMGGFTTFSMLSLEFVDLVKNNHYTIACVYIGLTNLVGLGLCAFGYTLIK